MALARTSNRRRQCDGKQRFDNKRTAKEVVRKVERKYGERLAAYRCPWCGQFHIGNRP